MDFKKLIPFAGIFRKLGKQHNKAFRIDKQEKQAMQQSQFLVPIFGIFLNFKNSLSG